VPPNTHRHLLRTPVDGHEQTACTHSFALLRRKSKFVCAAQTHARSLALKAETRTKSKHRKGIRACRKCIRIKPSTEEGSLCAWLRMVQRFCRILCTWLLIPSSSHIVEAYTRLASRTFWDSLSISWCSLAKASWWRMRVW